MVLTTTFVELDRLQAKTREAEQERYRPLVEAVRETELVIDGLLHSLGVTDMDEVHAADKVRRIGKEVGELQAQVEACDDRIAAALRERAEMDCR